MVIYVKEKKKVNNVYAYVSWDTTCEILQGRKLKVIFLKDVNKVGLLRIFPLYKTTILFSRNFYLGS